MRKIKTISIHGVEMKAMTCYGKVVLLHSEYETALHDRGVYLLLDHVNRTFYVGRALAGEVHKAVRTTVLQKFDEPVIPIGSIELRISTGTKKRQNETVKRLVKEHTAMGYTSLNCDNHWSRSENL